MKRLSAPSAIALSIALLFPVSAVAKPKPLVQVYGLATEIPKETPTTTFYTAFLILPDGTHALAICAENLGNTCSIEPVPIEKRIKVSCALVKEDITLRTAQGKVSYRVFMSW